MQIHYRRFLNNFKTTLTASWGTSGGASIPTIASGEMDDLLAATVEGEHIIATLSNADDSVVEIIRLIRGASAFTSERGQDGTSALSWDSGANLSVRVTSDTLNEIIREIGPQPFNPIGNYRAVGANNYVTVALDNHVLDSTSAKKLSKIDLTADTTQIRFTSSFPDLFYEIFFIAVFGGAASIPSVQLNGVTKMPSGTAPTNGIDYMIKVTFMGALGVRLEYLTKS